VTAFSPRRALRRYALPFPLVIACGCAGYAPAPGVVAPPPVVVAPPRPAAVPPRTVADEFVVTFWCGPPLQSFDDARAREIAAAGFNLIGATCEGHVNPTLNTRALRIAERHGLRMLIKDARVSAAQPLADGWQQKASNAIATYRGHPGLAGFFLLDEPSDASIYPDISALRRRLQREAPGVIGYVNLLPDYVFRAPDEYRDYVESYLFRTHPEMLSYDHYPFLTGGDRPSFFDNLSVIRALALDYQVPFLLIVQLMPHADYRDVTWPELAWQVFHAVAFGARGVSYFAYWTPTQVPDNIAYRFRNGIIEGGLRTEHYEHVARLNPQIRAIADALEGFTSVAVWDSLGQFGEGPRPPVVAGVDSGEITAGSFLHDDGRTAVLVVNREYRQPARFSVQRSDTAPQVFDPKTRSWSNATDQIELPPGEGRLLR
jgi:hypothetical protein